MRKLKPIERRRAGRPPKSIDWARVTDLVRRGASIPQVRDMMHLSHGTAQRAVTFVRDQIKAAAEISQI